MQIFFLIFGLEFFLIEYFYLKNLKWKKKKLYMEIGMLLRWQIFGTE
jgi:hypothetical protein